MRAAVELLSKKLGALLTAAARHIGKPDGSLSASHFSAPLEPEKVVSVSGAGDSLNSGILAGLVHGLPLDKCFQLGHTCAALTLQTIEAVSPDIKPHLLSL